MNNILFSIILPVYNGENFIARAIESVLNQTFENFELADGRYAVGLGDYIELQDAKVNYNNAQNTYVQAVYNYNVARANLERLIALPQEIEITVED